VLKGLVAQYQLRGYFAKPLIEGSKLGQESL
jgi:hypothetical protein